MSGYLRSLAAGAPGPSLRPITTPFARAPLAAADHEPMDAGTDTPAGGAPPVPAPPPSATTREADTRAIPRPLTAVEVVRRLTELPADRQPAPPPHVKEMPPDPRQARRDRTAHGGLTTPVPRTIEAPQQERPARESAAAGFPRGKPLPAIAPAVPLPAPRAAEPRRAAASRDDAPAEVHIHIGRIELTAVTPATPPRRPPAVKPAMPLDEYLQRRNGKTR